jgi:hypothetical protein
VELTMIGHFFIILVDKDLDRRLIFNVFHPDVCIIFGDIRVKTHGNLLRGRNFDIKFRKPSFQLKDMFDKPNPNLSLQLLFLEFKFFLLLSILRA